MKRKAILLVTALIIGSVSLYAKRSAPKDVTPVVYQGIKYSAPSGLFDDATPQNGGYIEAIDVESGKPIWKLLVYEIIEDPKIERDVQDIFITSLKTVDGNLEVVNEAGDKFIVDISKRKVTTGTNRVYRFKEK